MRKGFTIIELLVASLLLATLVSILTMMFNQSSIAWRTGTAGIVDLNRTRGGLGAFEDIRDDVLPGLGDQDPNVGASDSRTIKYRTVSLWQKNQDNQLRTDRAFNYDKAIQWGDASSAQFSISDAKTAKEKDLSDKGAGNSVSLFSVGVRSLGPDGQPDTEDDINTWPEEID